MLLLFEVAMSEEEVKLEFTSRYLLVGYMVVEVCLDGPRRSEFEFEFAFLAGGIAHGVS